ncbi:MAG: STAS domain-containing protein [Parabacteroides sp.]|nr:STAS domain-containing protein [Parabacteroides sp.]
MKITIDNGKETVISLSGELDTLTSVDLEKEIAPILNGEAEAVVLNGAELTYISSAGLRLLLTLQKGMKAKGGGKLSG